MAVVDEFGNPLPVQPRPGPRRRSISFTRKGYKPDWKALIENDPTFMQNKGRLAGLSAAAKAARNAGIKQRLIGYGALPPGIALTDLADYGIDDATRAAIAANTNPNTSTTAGLQQENARNIQALQDMLAARGMLRSGSLGVGLGQEQERYAGAQTDARNKLLAALAGLQSEFAAGEAEREEQLYGMGGYADQARRGLEDSGLYEETPDTQATATLDPNTGLYVDADGNYYDENGTPTVPGSGLFGPGQMDPNPDPIAFYQPPNQRRGRFKPSRVNPRRVRMQSRGYR